VKNLRAVPVFSLIILSFTILIIPLTLTLLKKKTNIREEAATPTGVDINTFRTPYTNLKGLMDDTNRIFNFSGTTYLSEFDNTDSGIYTLNLGNFWAYLGNNGSFWTRNLNEDWNKTKEERWSNWRDGFSHTIMLFDRKYGKCEVDTPVPFSSGTWYPSKMVVTRDWNIAGMNDARITGIKTGIPNYQGFAFKLRIENNVPMGEPLELNILSETILNQIFGEGITNPKRGKFEYDVSNKASTFSNGNAFMAIGFGSNSPAVSFRLSDKALNSQEDLIYQDFKDNGVLNSQGSDSVDVDGSQAGLVAQLPAINPGSSYEATVYFVFGSTKQVALSNLQTIRQTFNDIEKTNDDYWNQQLAILYGQIPDLHINDPELEKMYRNAFLNIPMNHFKDSTHDFYSLGDRAYFALFPWQFYFSSFPHILADKNGFKNVLKTNLKININIPNPSNPFSGNKSINPLTEKGGGGYYHSFAPSSIVFAFYDYLSLTQDWDFLNEIIPWLNPGIGITEPQPVIKWLEHYAYHFEQDDWMIPKGDGTDSSAGGKMIDFGTDQNLYEIRSLVGGDPPWPACNLTGKYNGKTPLPNGERYMIHKIMSEIYTHRGESVKAAVESDRAFKVKEALNNELWNETEGWYDSIALYNSALNYDVATKRPTPLKNTFKAIWIFNLLRYPGLVDLVKRERIISHLGEYEGAYGFNAISNLPGWKENWCTRYDYHGPGLYIGDTAKIISDLFQNGKISEGYRILNKIRYMANSSYYAQCIDGARPKFSSGRFTDCQASAYVDGSSIAQMFIYGLFGVRAKTDGFQVSPSFPDELMSKGVASLTNFKMGDKVYEIVIDPAATSAGVTNLGGNNFRVRLPNKTYFFVEFNNNYLTPTPLPPTVTRIPTPTPTLTPVPTSTPIPTAIPTTCPVCPGNVTVSGFFNNTTHKFSYIISWGASAGAISYNVYRDGSLVMGLIYDFAGTSASDNNLGSHFNPGESHCYVVAPVKAGCSSPSCSQACHGLPYCDSACGQGPCGYRDDNGNCINGNNGGFMGHSDLVAGNWNNYCCQWNCAGCNNCGLTALASPGMVYGSCNNTAGYCVCTPTPTLPTATGIPTSTPTPTATITPRPTSTPIPTVIPCARKTEGDADCNGRIDIIDFEIWRRELLGVDTTLKADFDGIGGVTILDFEIWRRGFLSQ